MGLVIPRVVSNIYDGNTHLSSSKTDDTTITTKNMFKTLPIKTLIKIWIMKYYPYQSSLLLGNEGAVQPKLNIKVSQCLLHKLGSYNS